MHAAKFNDSEAVCWVEALVEVKHSYSAACLSHLTRRHLPFCKTTALVSTLRQSNYQWDQWSVLDVLRVFHCEVHLAGLHRPKLATNIQIGGEVYQDAANLPVLDHSAICLRQRLPPPKVRQLRHLQAEVGDCCHLAKHPGRVFNPANEPHLAFTRLQYLSN